MSSATRLLSVACCLVLCLQCGLTAAEPDWPQWRGSQRDGKARGETIRTDWKTAPPRLLWKMPGIGSGYGSPAIVDDKLYVMGDREDGQYVFAVDLTGRDVIWSTKISGALVPNYPGSRGTPTVDEDLLYVVSGEGVLVCLNRWGGDVEWKKDFALEFGSEMQRWGYAESPLVDGDRVIATPGADDAMLAAFDKYDGKILWTTPYPELGPNGRKEAGYASMVISHGGGVKQYVQAVGKGLVGVRAEDGHYLWGNHHIANRAAVIPTPLVDGDYVFASSSYDAGSVCVRLDPAGEGEVRAKVLYTLDGREFQNHHGQMILHEGHVYGGTGKSRGFPVCIELKTGRIVWGRREDRLRGPQGSSGSAAVVFADGHLIWRYQNGLIAITPATPEAYGVKGTFTPPVVETPSWSAPAIVDGKMYLRENDTLMVFDVSEV